MTDKDKVIDRNEARRRRYQRAAPETPLLALTPPKAAMLRYLAECRLLSLPQLARLVCPRPDLLVSQKAARRHLRPLFDAGLVDVLPVARAALAGPEAANDETLLQGTAPNIYVPTALGLEALYRAGWIDEQAKKMSLPRYGPKNSLFLAHELMVRDVRVWLEECARESLGEQQVLKWVDGTDAALPFEGGSAKPDAWFVYQLKAGEPPTVLVGLVEVDRGTERGDRHWRQKVRDYAALFESGYLVSLTGYHRARVLVFTSGEGRRDVLARRIKEEADRLERTAELSTRFWITDCQSMSGKILSAHIWKRIDENTPRALYQNTF